MIEHAPNNQFLTPDLMRCKQGEEISQARPETC
jgi:hypothetical protein